MEALARRVAARQRISLLDLTREYEAHRQEMLAACGRVFERMHLLGGEEVSAFESEMATYLGVRHVRGVASGTDALLLAMRSAGIEPGDEVLIQANAFVAAVEAIHGAGAVPVPVDIRLDDLGPDPEALAAALGPRTRGIVVVHLYGLPVQLAPVLTMVRERGLVLIEDCSHAHGATLDGRRVGSFGAAGAFSLGVVKNLAAYGDAGMVSTNDPALAERVRLLGTHGQARKNEHAFYGTNSRLDELHAALLRVKLRLLDGRNRRRAEIASYYDDCFRALLTTPPADPSRTHVYHQYVVRTRARDALREHLGAHGVDAGVHFPVPIHRQPAWLSTYGESPAQPRAEQAAREILSLPVHPDLRDDEVERVADAVVGFFPPMSAAEAAPYLSLVIPVYDEEENVAPLHAELTRAAAAVGRPYEIVFVNDGSRDDTLGRLQELQAADPHLRVVDLEGNSGEAAALSAGFAHARGEVVVTLDGDGQNDPADIPRLLAALGPDVDVVSGRRRARKEKLWSRVLPSRIANGLIVLATGVPAHDCGCGLKAYRRGTVAGTQLPRGMNRFLPAILGVDPARVAEVWVSDRRRGSGRSHYGPSRTFVVLRDLLALPLLTRRAVRPPLRQVQTAAVAILVALIVGGLGRPAVGTSVAPGVLAVAGAVVAAIAYDLTRVARARARGVFHVRRVLG